MKPPVAPPHLPTKKGFLSENWPFPKTIYPLKIHCFAEKQPFMDTIVSPLLFRNLNVFSINIWERVKPEFPKEVS